MTSALPADYFATPSVARVQDHLDGGTDNYLVDREFAHGLRAVAPWLPASVRINRAHGPRILTFFARELGIDQVIDLGCGLPHDDHASLPDAVRRIVYVDHDPGVAAHARMSLAERHGTAALHADLKDMPALLAADRVARLDRTRPIGVLLHDVLPWISDEAARTALAALKGWLPPGSALSLTHATTDTAPDTMAGLAAHYARASIVFRPRTRQQIQDLVRPWTALDEGGPATTASWRRPPLHPDLDHSHAYAILASPGDRTP
ncbi:SAM-dependent methyltransferase [Streptomyces desertarenae]|uniref:SAM-dependent methyltransferase n=1 Tax=Streptomyces desertarenae TaxID=2666184 RepID=A0ABW4PJ34_9ACTN